MSKEKNENVKMENSFFDKNSVQIISFLLNNQNYGINILHVHEIIKKTKITRVPNAEYFIEGVINRRGDIIPVLNLRKKFEINQSDYDENSMIIILENESEYMGILIDSVKEVITFSADMLENTPKTNESDISLKYIRCVGKISGKIITLLHEDKLLRE